MGIKHHQVRLLQQDISGAAEARSPAMELANPHEIVAAEVAQVVQLASHYLQQAAESGKSALKKIGQGVQRIHQQLRFPNLQIVPTLEYVFSKIEQNVQVVLLKCLQCLSAVRMKEEAGKKNQTYLCFPHLVCQTIKKVLTLSF